MNLIFQNLTEIKKGLSNKKIFRKFDKKLKKIVIDFSKEKKEFYNFLDTYQILKKINISIPKIYEVYLNKKIIVMEDFGDETFDKLYNKEDLYYLLKISVDNLIIINNSLIINDLAKLKKYSIEDLKLEISEFVDFYIPQNKIEDFPKNEFYDCWESIYNIENFEFNSFCHKDFEFINLIYLDKNKNHLKCGIIDFQSAFSGFIGWDLFSILENPRLNFTRKYNEGLIKYFYDNININIEFNSFRNQYYLLNLVRQTRLLGRWIKLFNEENNKHYLNYINTTKKRIIPCLTNLQNDKLKTIYERVLKINV